jgi:hypothetical protein
MPDDNLLFFLINFLKMCRSYSNYASLSGRMPDDQENNINVIKIINTAGYLISLENGNAAFLFPGKRADFHDRKISIRERDGGCA